MKTCIQVGRSGHVPIQPEKQLRADIPIGSGRRAMLSRALLIMLVAAYSFVALSLLFSSFCAFTNYRFALCDPDYVNYVNMLWNSAHGRPFVCPWGSYLSAHLSFSLLLLAPFFRIWDHPFLLSFLQWLLIVGGSLFVGLSAWRHRLPRHFTLILMLFFVGYHFTQTVQLDEFHGVRVPGKGQR